MPPNGNPTPDFGLNAGPSAPLERWRPSIPRLEPSLTSVRQHRTRNVPCFDRQTQLPGGLTRRSVLLCVLVAVFRLLPYLTHCCRLAGYVGSCNIPAPLELTFHPGAPQNYLYVGPKIAFRRGLDTHTIYSPRASWWRSRRKSAPRQS